jgi:hypothetical protein
VGAAGNFLTSKTYKESRVNFPAFAKLVSVLGTKAAPLLDGNRGYVLLIVS